ncbi:MAG TPA: glutamyl-tRNA reductase [Methanothermobacter sp.]|nr:glutamyl-tRNA reductase [Methanothermobacter sp.]HOK73176.1 glutamyl-tRNA reductase [Methanothermobacter sp.]HOL68808.1 glutamyl-tRNA reductase [Methanothermobacter sp.]HPQ04701.1 glutamyl-tRNA reductase [Methanothermobacter sp.]HPU36711.1 glutamyl-tRNA reductase [Methanothermobacter sp.]
MILNIRVDHKIADIEKIEKADKTLEEILKQLKDNIQEHIPIKTCNRIEHYLILKNPIQDMNHPNIIIEEDKKALKHLLRLASGLESMIIGEDQILGQIKDARLEALKRGLCGPTLDMIFNKAVHVGQIIRNKTKINKGSVSIGSAAVELAESVQGDLKCKKVLVIGAGEMGALVARALAEKQLKAIVVANRTYDRAVRLARELGGYAIQFDRLDEALSDADVVISATAAPHYILTRERVEKAIPIERRDSVTMIDIANPRDIEEKVRELGIRLFNIDDLRGIAEKNRRKRENEARKAEQIIEKELELLVNSLKYKKVEPLISQIRKSMEEIRIRETEKAMQMLGELEDKEKIIDDLTRSIVNKIFHDIISKLRKAAEEDDEELIKACEKLFN